MARPTNRGKFRNNFGQFARTASIGLKKELLKRAKELEQDIVEQVEKDLKQTYIENVEQSFMARTLGNAEYNRKATKYNEQKKQEELDDRKLGIMSRRSRKTLTYRHTDTLLGAIHTEVVKNANNVTVKIVLDENEKYKGPETFTRTNQWGETHTYTRKNKTVGEVYEMLEEGTEGGGVYPYKQVGNDVLWAPNYPTPPHDFERHTMVQMEAKLRALEEDISRKYNKKKGR